MEHVGADMGIQIPLLLLAGEVSRSCLHGPEPVGSTHLRFGDARVVMGNSMWLPKVVQSHG